MLRKQPGRLCKWHSGSGLFEVSHKNILAYQKKLGNIANETDLVLKIQKQIVKKNKIKTGKKMIIFGCGYGNETIKKDENQGKFCKT